METKNQVIKAAFLPPDSAEQTTAFARLEASSYEVIERISRGETFTSICENLNIGMSTFARWKSQSKHSKEVDNALVVASEAYVDKAQNVLQEFIDNGTENMAQASLVREMAQLMKWKASKRNAPMFGDKKEVHHTQETVVVSDDQFAQYVAAAQSSVQIENKENQSEYIEFSQDGNGQV